MQKLVKKLDFNQVPLFIVVACLFAAALNLYILDAIIVFTCLFIIGVAVRNKLFSIDVLTVVVSLLILLGLVFSERSAAVGSNVEPFFRYLLLLISASVLIPVVRHLAASRESTGLYSLSIVFAVVSLLFFAISVVSFLDDGRAKHYSYGLTHFGFLLSGILLVVLYLILYWFQNYKRSTFGFLVPLALFISAVLLAGALLLNLSRGVWLAMAMAVGLLLFLLLPWRNLLVASAAFCVLVIFGYMLVGDIINKRFYDAFFELSQYIVYQNQAGSFGERLGMWHVGVNAFLQNPIVGVGFDGLKNLQAQMLENGQISELVSKRKFLHSDILQSLAVFGFLGFLTYLAYWYRLLKLGRGILMPVLVSMILLAGLSDHYFFLNSTLKIIAFLILLTIVVENYFPVDLNLANRVIVLARLKLLLIGLIVLVVGLFAGYQFRLFVNGLEFAQRTNESSVKSVLLENGWIVNRMNSRFVVELPSCEVQFASVLFVDIFGVLKENGQVKDFADQLSVRVPNETPIDDSGFCVFTWELSNNYKVRYVVVGTHDYGPRHFEYKAVFNDQMEIISAY